jgi:hypothetical protein
LRKPKQSTSSAAIYWASQHRRREVEVGASTVIAIWGDKFAAGLGDRYLARTGYESQQHGGPEDPNRPHNLWEPVDEDRDFGAHGKFDARAHSHSPQLWTNTHLGLALAGAGAIGAGMLALMRRNGNGHGWTARAWGRRA